MHKKNLLLFCSRLANQKSGKCLKRKQTNVIVYSSHPQFYLSILSCCCVY